MKIYRPDKSDINQGMLSIILKYNYSTFNEQTITLFGCMHYLMVNCKWLKRDHNNTSQLPDYEVNLFLIYM